jgi:hypothetical protein
MSPRALESYPSGSVEISLPKGQRLSPDIKHDLYGMPTEVDLTTRFDELDESLMSLIDRVTQGVDNGR